MKVLSFGSINIDLLFAVDHIVKPGETIRGNSFIKSAGGKGANQAASLAKAGLNVFMAGKTGNGAEFILELLRSYGVNTSYVVQSSAAPGQAVIQIDKNGQNSIVLFPGGNEEITEEEIEKTIAGFDAGDIIVLQNEINNTDKIMTAAKDKGMKICFNPSPYSEKISSLPLNLVNRLFVNEIEGAALASLSQETAKETIVKKLISMFPNAEIILTAGENGALYGFGGKIIKTEIVKTKTIDTTGAGDTFTGFFIAAREMNKSAVESLKIAAKAAAIAVSRKGAMESIPYAREVFN